MARVFEELFESTGYDETWVSGETVGTGCTLDEDYASSNAGSPTGWGSYCLRSVAASTGYNAYVEDGNLGSAKAITYFCMEIYIVSESLGDGNWMNLFAAADSGWEDAWVVRLIQSSGSLKLQLNAHHDDADEEFTGITTLSTATVYRVEVKWDATNDAWAWRINGTDQPNNVDGSDPVESEGSLTLTHPTDVQWLRCGVSNVDSVALEVLFDRVIVDDADWVGAAGTTHSLESALPTDGVQSASTVAADATRVRTATSTPAETSAVTADMTTPLGAFASETIQGETSITAVLVANVHGASTPAETSLVAADMHIPLGPLYSEINARATVTALMTSNAPFFASLTAVSTVTATFSTHGRSNNFTFFFATHRSLRGR